jgi:hypothetical protein
MKPIVEYDNFLFNGSQIYGLSKTLGYIQEPIIVMDEDDKPLQVTDFFRVDGSIYVTVLQMKNTGTAEEPVWEQVEICYKQTKGTVSKIKKADMPDCPEQKRIEYKSADFEVFKDKYQEEPLSKVRNITKKTGAHVFRKISGCVETDDGLFFNVIKGVPETGWMPGVYFYPNNQKVPQKIAETGNFY